MGRKYSDHQDDYPTTGITGYGGSVEPVIKGSQDQSNNPERNSLDDIWDDRHIPNGGPVIQ